VYLKHSTMDAKVHDKPQKTQKERRQVGSPPHPHPPSSQTNENRRSETTTCDMGMGGATITRTRRVTKKRSSGKRTAADSTRK
jgi:hypothetical protein